MEKITFLQEATSGLGDEHVAAWKAAFDAYLDVA